jgi:hypothetical protein
MRNGRRRPLVLIITKIQNLQIQQYAERWAIRGSVLMTHTSAIFLNLLRHRHCCIHHVKLPVLLCPALSDERFRDDVWPYTLLRESQGKQLAIPLLTFWQEKQQL